MTSLTRGRRFASRRQENRAPIRLVHLTTVPDCLFFIRGQVRYMVEQGFDVRIVSSPSPRLEDFARGEGVLWHGVPMTRRITPLQDVISVFRLWRYFRAWRPHIVHAHTPKAGFLAMLAATLACVPVRIYHLRGFRAATLRGVLRSILELCEWIACSLATHVLSVSHSLSQLVAELGLCARERVETLLQGSGNGVDAIERFNPAHQPPVFRHATRRQYGIPEDALVIGFIGRVARDKGWIELAEAWRRLRGQFSKLHVMVVGPLEEHDPIPDEIVHQMHDDPRVHWIGENWETPPLFAALDILALPSYREGFPTVLLEAAAMEKPVVASRAIGCVDAVQHEITGLLVPVGDALALTAALQRYIQNPHLRRMHGAAARRRVLADFQQRPVWEAIRERYCALLAEAGIVAPTNTVRRRSAA